MLARPEIMVSIILKTIVISHNPRHVLVIRTSLCQGGHVTDCVDMRMWEPLGDIFESLIHSRSINKHGRHFLTVLCKM